MSFSRPQEFSSSWLSLKPHKFKKLYSALAPEKKQQLLFPEDDTPSILEKVDYAVDHIILNTLLAKLDRESLKKAYAKLPVQVLLKRAILNDNPQDLQFICWVKKVDINKALSPLDSPISLAIKHARIKALTFLFTRKALNPNLPIIKESSRSPLILAVTTGNTEITQFLCDQPTVNLYYADHIGMTAFDFAKMLKLPAISSILTAASRKRPETESDKTLREKNEYATRIMHELGLSRLDIHHKHNGKSFTFSSTGGSFEMKSSRHLLEDFKAIHNPANLEHRTIIDALEANADFYTYNGNETIESLVTRFHTGQFLMFSSGWRRHALALIFYKNNLVICNRGEGADKLGHIAIYTIDPQKVDATYLRKCWLQYGPSKHFAIVDTPDESSRDDLIKFKLDHIKSIILNSKPIKILKAKAQNHGTCSFVNPKSAIQAILYLLKIDELKADYGDEVAHRDAEPQAYKAYKKITKDLRDNAIDTLIAHINDDDQLREDQEFYINLSLEILANTKLNLNNSNKLSRLTRLLTALFLKRDAIYQSPQLTGAYRKVVMTFASCPDKRVYREALPLLEIKRNQLEKLKKTPKVIFYLLNNLLNQCIEAGHNLSYLSLAETLIKLRTFDILEILKNSVSNFEEVNILLNSSLNLAHIPLLITSIEKRNIEKISCCLWLARTIRTPKMINQQKAQLALNNPLYFLHLLKTKQTDFLEENLIKCFLKIALKTNSKIYAKCLDFLDTLKAQLKKDLVAAKANHTLCKTLRDWTSLCALDPALEDALLPILLADVPTRNALTQSYLATTKEFVDMIKDEKELTNAQLDLYYQQLAKGISPHLYINHKTENSLLPYRMNMLYLASEKGRLDIVKLLVFLGANIHAIILGRTAQQIALHKGHKEISDFLIHHAASSSMAKPSQLGLFAKLPQNPSTHHLAISHTLKSRISSPHTPCPIKY